MELIYFVNLYLNDKDDAPEALFTWLLFLMVWYKWKTRDSRVAGSILERLGRFDGSSNLHYPINEEKYCAQDLFCSFKSIHKR